MARRPDLTPVDLEFAKLPWTPDEMTGSLLEVISEVRKSATEAINWYVAAKEKKRRGATFTRGGTIIATTATVFFTAALGLGDQGAQLLAPVGPGPLAALAAAAAGILQGFDRFFGFSKAWIRYISTELKIRTALNAFDVGWPSRKLSWEGGTPNEEQVREAIAACAAFVAEVDAAVRQETDQWIADFQANLKDLEEATKVAAAAAKAASEAQATLERQREADKKAEEDAARPGSINLTVTNGDGFDIWTITEPSAESAKPRSGKTAAIPDVGPGSVRVIVEANDEGGKPRRAEKFLDVPAATPTDCSVTLE